jgi:hypothetical protein
MTNPTSNFGWQMPTPTDLVTDLPADFEVFGQAVDSDFVDLLGGTTGQILSKTSNTDLDFTWITNDVGDITAVNVTSPITGGGSAGAVTIGINAATTSVVGAVQLSDSTSTTSSVLASTPTATKAAYDLADAAIAKSVVTTAGDIIYRNATVPTRLGIGTAGQVLQVNSGATAPEWITPAGSATTYTLLNAGGTALAGSSTSVTGISGKNKLFVYVAGASSTAASAYVLGYINNDTASNYRWFGLVSTNGAGATGDGTATSSELFFGQLGSSAANTISGSAFIDGANNTGIKPFTLGAKADGSSSNDSPMIQGFYVGTSTVSSIYIKTDAGAFDAGTLFVYGA